MSTAPFPVQPELTAVAIAFVNKRAIADRVLLRASPMTKKEFKYRRYDFGQNFTVPDTRVGRTSKPNQVEMKSEDVTASTQDYGLEDPIPQDDIDQAPPGQNLLMGATEWLTNLIVLDREVRTAGLVFNPTNYGSGLTKDLAAGEKFDNPESDPLGVLSDALDAPVMRPNVAVVGRKAFSKLARHPQLVKAYHGNDGGSGIVPAKFIAEVLELEELLIGEALFNTAKRGKTPVMTRAWGPHMALHYRDQAALSGRGALWGWTAQYKTRVAGSKPDGDIGLRGGQMVRVGESVAEVVAAPELGFLLQNLLGTP
ncbi:MAG: phage capsid protein [Magnetococcales bacterium]|nr:phage capsid protein [Magnetococcales bacterium]